MTPKKCKRGHLLVPENLTRNGKGNDTCKKCRSYFNAAHFQKLVEIAVQNGFVEEL